MMDWQRCIRRAAVVTGLILWVSAGQAQDWGRKMLDHTTHDFGVVARGAKAEHRFIVENVYEEEMQIQLTQPECGCVKAQTNRPTLKTWEKAEILVTVDTRLLGRKDATIEVTFIPPPPMTRTTVQLHTHVYIRSDVVVQKPGAVLFGSVDQGTEAKQSVTVDYAGRDDWQIVKVECANPFIEAHAVETSRTPGQPAGPFGEARKPAQIGYTLSARLKDNAPAGYIHDKLILVTNDQNSQVARVPVDVEGLVVAALSAPAQLLWGVVEVGQPVTRNLPVQGRVPFRILSVQASDERFQCKVPSDSKTYHILPVTFLAKEAGNYSAKIHIETDLAGGNSVDVSVSAQVRSAPPAKP